MQKRWQLSNEGFTLIEIALALLLAMMVFIALPSYITTAINMYENTGHAAEDQSTVLIADLAVASPMFYEVKKISNNDVVVTTVDGCTITLHYEPQTKELIKRVVCASNSTSAGYAGTSYKVKVDDFKADAVATNQVFIKLTSNNSTIGYMLAPMF